MFRAVYCAGWVVGAPPVGAAAPDEDALVVADEVVDADEVVELVEDALNEMSLGDRVRVQRSAPQE